VPLHYNFKKKKNFNHKKAKTLKKKKRERETYLQCKGKEWLRNKTRRR
jgi:hypothetical protein